MEKLWIGRRAKLKCSSEGWQDVVLGGRRGWRMLELGRIMAHQGEVGGSQRLVSDCEQTLFHQCAV